MRIKGFAYASYWNGQFAKTASDQSLNNLVATGANWISVTSTWFTDSLTSSGIKALSDTESNANVALAITDAHDRNLQVMLKPHIDPNSGEWRGLYAPTSPTDWFAAYKGWIVEQARLASSTGAEVLVLGTELDSMAGAAYRAQWQDIISAVRAVYSGQLTYSAVLERASGVCFWDLLDFASVTAYPTAGSDGSVSPGQIEESWIAGDSYWKSPLMLLSDLQQSTGKQVVITEVGYRSVDGAIRDPGSYSGKGFVDITEQLEGYRGLLGALELLETRSWFEGALLWKWDPVPQPSVAYSASGYNNNDYSVQERPQALAEITSWFAGGAPLRNLLAGTAASELLTGSAGDDVMAGGSGNDTLNGGDGNDRFSGGLGNDSINGGAGSDTLSFLGEQVAVSVTLGEGTATGTATGLGSDSLLSIENLFGSDKGDTLRGNSAANSLWGSAGADKLYGMDGNDYLEGGPGADTIDGGAGVDTLSYIGALSAVTVKLDTSTATGTASGGGGSDRLTGIENLTGSNYNDSLTGNSLANLLAGGVGNDSLSGSSGNDTLVGGAGVDSLTGGAGSDVFLYKTGSDSGATSATADVIADFVRGQDKLDLRGIDASSLLAGDQAFSGPVVGGSFSGSFSTAAGSLYFDKVAHILYGNTDGDVAAEFAIRLNGVATLTTSDLLL